MRMHPYFLPCHSVSKSVTLSLLDIVCILSCKFIYLHLSFSLSLCLSLCLSLSLSLALCLCLSVYVWLTSQAEDRVKEEDPKNGRKTAKSFYKRKSLLQGIMNTPYKQYVFDSLLLFINTTILCLRRCVV